MIKQCAVKKCSNKSSQGIFKGNLCLPCYMWLSKRKAIDRNCQAFKNELEDGKCNKLLIDLIFYRQQIADEVADQHSKGNFKNLGKEGCFERIDEIIKKYI